MKTWQLVPAVILVLTAIGCGALAMSPPGQFSQVVLEGRLNCPCVPSGGGHIYLQIAVTAQDAGRQDRKPVNLCVVLDRSGSMAEEGKITNAKAALLALIDQLRSCDVFSLVIYDDVVDVLRHASLVGDRRELRDLVEGIQPRGWTNLSGGMVQGYGEAERYEGPDYVSRVVLISDGLANRGVTDPCALCRIARQHLPISLTTIGVGLDYNENLMIGLADGGGGNYYFIESSRRLSSILRREFNQLGCVALRNAVIDIRLGPCVKAIDVVGAGYSGGDGHCVIPLGDLEAGERREYTVELEIPGGSGSGLVAEGEVRSGGVGGTPLGSFQARVSYSADAAEIERKRDMDVQAHADVAMSTRRVERAMDALDEGKQGKALEELSAAREALKASPAASCAGAGAAIKAQETVLGSYQQTIEDSRGDLRKTKKVIQFHNYQMQRGKR